MDRPDARDLEVGEGAVEPLALGGRRRRIDARLLDPRAQAELHLAGGLLGEGDGDDALERVALLVLRVAEDGDDAADELGGLPRPGGGLDDQRAIEALGDGAARVPVDERARSRGARGEDAGRRRGLFASAFDGGLRTKLRTGRGSPTRARGAA